VSEPDSPVLQEVWRGGVNAWECDEMGHMNTRFYVARSIEALAVLFGMQGLPGLFSPASATTVVMEEQHIRFHTEARAAAPLDMSGGFVDIGDATALVVLVMRHSLSGNIAATFRFRLTHVEAKDGETPVAWPAAFRDKATAHRIPLPNEAAPRSVGDDPVFPTASLTRAMELGLTRIAMGMIGAESCDPFGRMQPQKFTGAISDGVRQLTAPLREIIARNADLVPSRYGGAVLEFRILHRAWPRAGDCFEIRSGFQGADQRTMSLVHWMLDPLSDRVWGSVQLVAIVLDLDARKIVPISAAATTALAPHAISGLKL
jgi:acyl-CoA thioester hydrolase